MLLKQIHKDKRGEIYIIYDISGKEIANLLITKQGYARGGCIHRVNDEYCTIINGNVTYHVKDKKPMVLYKGKVVTIPRLLPHYFISDTDSIVMEYGAGAGDKDPEFRKIVDEINSSN